MRLLPLLVVLMLATSSCSVKKYTMGKMADALASSGTGTTFAGDDDPELIEAALPFSLKLMEALLVELPDHQGLLLATASGFTQYSMPLFSYRPTSWRGIVLRPPRFFAIAHDAYTFEPATMACAGWTPGIRAFQPGFSMIPSPQFLFWIRRM